MSYHYTADNKEIEKIFFLVASETFKRAEEEEEEAHDAQLRED
jgi:hypothetical protein